MVGTDVDAADVDDGSPSDGVRLGLPVARNLVPPAVTLVVVLGAWESFALATDVPPVLVPGPADVARAAVAAGPLLAGDALVTGTTAGIGLLGGVVVGGTLAYAMTRSRAASTLVQPYVVLLRIAPVIAIAPLAFLWLGDGILARGAVVTTMTVFPVTVGSLDGLRSVPREYLDLASSVDAAGWRVFLFVRLPAAAPSVFAGVKLAAVLSVTGAVVTEFVTLSAGLGYRVFHASTALRTPRLFAALGALALLGIGFYLVPAAVERRVRWR